MFNEFSESKTKPVTKPPSKPTKKRKKPKPKKPTIVLSAWSRDMAEKYANFVRSQFPAHQADSTEKRRKISLNKWAEYFQTFIDQSDHSQVQIQTVFDWYTLHWCDLWRLESPKTFCKCFATLLRRYEKTFNPYAPQKLRHIMQQLERFVWDCDPSQLILSVGRSLFTVKTAMSIMDKTLEDHTELLQSFSYIRGQIGNPVDFVRIHFETWFRQNNDTKQVRFAEITEKQIKQCIAGWLYQYGIDAEKVSVIVKQLYPPKNHEQ